MAIPYYGRWTNTGRLAIGAPPLVLILNNNQIIYGLFTLRMTRFEQAWPLVANRVNDSFLERNMADMILRYDRMVEAALRSVVREALIQVSKHGLPAEHHFYVTFDTNHPKVEIPDYLRQRYPSEMTIVLQHQFYGLKIQTDLFMVTLSFNNAPERLVVPYEAIRIFADPSVSFALQFESPYEGSDEAGNSGAEDDEDFDESALDNLIAETEKALSNKDGKGLKSGNKPAKKPEADEKRGEIVSLDAFRKKREQDN